MYGVVVDQTLVEQRVVGSSGMRIGYSLERTASQQKNHSSRKKGSDIYSIPTLLRKAQSQFPKYSTVHPNSLCLSLLCCPEVLKTGERQNRRKHGSHVTHRQADRLTAFWAIPDWDLIFDFSGVVSTYLQRIEWKWRVQIRGTIN